MTDQSLIPFFDPKGVAVVGVSRDPTKLGYGLARNLVQSGYQGAVHFVNPKGDSLLGAPIYASVLIVPDPVDLAVLLTPPAFVAGVLKECGERGIRAAIIASGGFREIGPEGAILENQCLEIARSYGIRLVGPNCIGLMDTHLPLDTTFLQPPMPPTGEIALISHSGAICAAVIDWIRGQGIGLSNLISLGNQADVNETDMLAPVAARKHTKVLTMYLEGISNGERFVSEALKVAMQKPVIALKVGRFESGRKAAASHTGALAGQEAAFDAAFRKAGVLRANTIEEMFQWARALAWCPLPKGRNVAVLTNAGGPGVTAADALELNDLHLAELSGQTHEALKAILPAAASLNNPVDMLASATPDQYAESLRILLSDPGVDSVMVISPPPPASTTGAVTKAMIPIIQMCDKPVIVTLMGDRLIQEGVELLRAARIPDYRFPEWAASCLGVLSHRAEFLAQAGERPFELAAAAVNPVLAAALLEGQRGGQFLDQKSANGLLEAYGIETIAPVLAASAEEAVQIAERWRYPVAVKVASPDILHKSDVKGVALGLENAQAVREAFIKVTENTRQARPEARIGGVHIQPMASPGQDVIVGMVRDARFGPVIMFGSGGVEVEGLKDVAFELAPLTQRQAERMLDNTWAGRKLKGFRSLPAADRQAVMQALARLAQLALDYPHLAEIEINPLRVLPEGQGALALDVRAKII